MLIIVHTRGPARGTRIGTVRLRSIASERVRAGNRHRKRICGSFFFGNGTRAGESMGQSTFALCHLKSRERAERYRIMAQAHRPFTKAYTAEAEAEAEAKAIC